MAQDRGTRGTTETRRKKRKDEYGGSDGSKVAVSKKPKPAPAPPPTHAYTPAPVTPYVPTHDRPYVFDRIRYPGANIFDLNERVEIANAAFTSQFGFEPSPGLLLDVVRGPMSNEDLVDMFKIPLSFASAQSAAEARTETLQTFEEEYQQAKEDYAAGRTTPEQFHKQEKQFERTREEASVQAMGPPGWLDELLVGTPVRGWTQIIESVAYAGPGMFYLGQAGYRDVGGAFGGDLSFKRTRGIGKAIGQQIVEDFRHPLRNVGYLTLDILGIASAGGGIAARGSAISRTSRATTAVRRGAEIPDLGELNLRPQTLNRVALGQRGRAVLSALSRRPLPGVVEVGLPGATETVLLRENATLRGIQRLYYSNLNRQLARRHGAEPATSYDNLTEFQRWRKSTFSAEATLGRTARARVRTERKVALAPIREADEIFNAADRVSHVYKSLPLIRKGKNISTGPESFGLTMGDHMALLFHATGGEDPVGLWRDFHTRFRDWGLAEVDVASTKIAQIQALPDGTPNKSDLLAEAVDELAAAETLVDNHNAKLVQVELGAQSFAKPSKYFNKALESFRRVSEAQESLKIQFLGLTPEIAANRIATERSILGMAQDAIQSKEAFLAKVDEVLGGPPLANQIDDAFYFFQGPADIPFNPNYVMGSARSSGMFGFPHPNPLRSFPELKHRYEGKAIMAGNTAVDARALTKKYALATRAVSTLEDYRRLVHLSVERPNDVPVHQRGFMRPIRTLDGIPDELRQRIAPMFEDRMVTGEEMAELMRSKVFENDDIKNLNEWLFPEYEVVNGVPRLKSGDAIEGVRWVDERMAVDLHRFPGEPGADAKAFRYINEPLRAGMLYYRLGYAANIASNAFMLLIHQGPAAPVNMAKSLLAGHLYSRQAIKAMDSLISEGKALSYLPDDIKALKLNRSAAHFWDRLVDRWMRRSALIWELERQGFKTSKQIEDLLDPTNRDKKVIAKRVEVSRRANKAMVEFDNLTWLEKKHLRHWVFVYPWVSRASVWALRTMLDHPIKTWTLSELGRYGEDKVWETLADAENKVEALTGQVAHVPDWVPEAGFFPISSDIDKNGNPRMLNFNSVNTFTTFADTYRNIMGLGSDDPFHGFEEMLGPAAEIGLRTVTKRDRYGQLYEHGALGGIAEIYASIPFGRTLAEGLNLPTPYTEDPTQPLTKDGTPKPVSSTLQLLRTPNATVDPSRRKVLEAQRMGGLFDPLISQGLWRPYVLDMEAAEESYWEDKTPEEREARRNEVWRMLAAQQIKGEIRNLVEAEKLTGKVIGKPVPEDVQKAVRLQADFQNAYFSYVVKNNRGAWPTDAEMRGIQIDVLLSRNDISPETAKDLHAELNKAVRKGDIGEFTDKFATDHLYAEAIRDWHNERDDVLEVAGNLRTQVEYLRANGLYKGSVSGRPLLKKGQLPGLEPGGGSPPTVRTATDIRSLGDNKADFEPVTGNTDWDSPFYKVGRVYKDFDLAAKAYEPADSDDQESVTVSEHRAWWDSQDKPIVIDGVSYPSPVRLKWASDVLNGTMDDPNYEAKQLAAMSAQTWDTLTDFEKEIVGRPGNFVARDKEYQATGSYGWFVYNAIADTLRGKPVADDVPPEIKDLLPPGPSADRQMDKKDRTRLAKYIDKYIVGGFYKDFLFKEEAKINRVRKLPVIYKSPFSKYWTDVLGAAVASQRYIDDLRRREKTGITDEQDRYKDYVRYQLLDYINRTAPNGFKAELQYLGGEDFLRTLVY